MNQSTSFAQVATNQFDYLSSALCANTPPCKKHSSSRKFLTSSISLRLLLVMLLTLTVSTAWGATAEFLPTNFSEQGTSGTGSAISATVNGVTFACDKGYGTTQFRCYGGSTITISSSNTITAISFTFSGSYKGGLETSYTNLNTNSWEKALSSQARITKCVVTYEEASIEPYTVTFHTTATTEEEIDEASAGAGVTPPTMEKECGEWTFMGWSESSSNSETNTTELELVTLTGEKYYPTEDVDLYPVYTKSEGGGGTVSWNKITTAPADWSGEYLIVNSDYAMTSDFKSGTSGEFVGANVTISNNQVTTSPSDKMIWIVEKNGSTAQYSFKNKSTGTYANITGTNSTNAALSASAIWFTISSSSTSGVWKINSVTYSARCFAYYSNNKTFRTYANSSNTTGSLYKKNGSSSTTYYFSYPQCATQTVVTLSPQGGSGGTPSVTATYGQPMPNITIPTRTGYDFQGYFTANGGTGTKYYNADGTSAQDWDKENPTFTLIAYWTPQTYTVTLNNQGATTAGQASVTATYNAAMPSIASNLPQKTGYTFNGYFDAASGGTQYYKADGTSAKNWDKTAANTILYAQWTCETPEFNIKIKDDNPVVFSGESIELTVDGSNIAADATYQWYKYNGTTYDELTGQTANKLTIAEATANDAGNYKCVVTNGTCSGENNYTVKMYHIKGLTDAGWEESFEFVKSGDKEGSFTIELAATTTYYFKLNDGSVWYWNEGTMTHNNCTNWVIEQEGADTQGKANTGITTTASGTYTFTLNYEDPSKPKLSVTYPQKKMVYFNPNMWADGATEVYTVYSWQDGSNGSFVTMTSVEGCGNTNIYQAEIDASHNKLLFIRWNQAHTAWDNNRWNQSIDLDYQTNGQYKIDDWGNDSELYWKDGAKKSWASYEKTFTPNYTVTFDANGHGSAPADQCIAEGGKVTTPTAPTATGYTFGGWYKEAGCTNAWDFDTDVVTSDITLYAKWTEKFTPTFAWSADSYTAALEADNTFPTLNNPNSLSVTYTSLNNGVATIDEDGNITLVATGTTTITATGTETATHKSATDTYKLIVVAANCKWIETDIANINSGDEVVITMTSGLGVTYALPSNQSTGSNPQAITVEIDGNCLKNNASTQYVWIINKDGENLTFESLNHAGYVLNCTNADAGVRVSSGSDKNKIFVIDPTSGYLKNTQTTDARYLGVHNTNYYWYCYKTYSYNTGGQTLKFYKKVCLDSENYWVTWDANGGQWSDGSTKKEEIYTVGATITKPADPTREGYKFTGWNPNPTTMPDENTTFKAQWAELHTITWMVGSSSVLSEDVANGTGVTQTPASNLEGDAIGDCADTFLGWSEKSAGSTPQDAAYYDDLCSAADMKSKYTSVTGDKTFYALFATATTTPGTSITQEETYSHTITSKTWDATGAKTLTNVSWTLANNGDYYGYDGTKGQQVGSGSKPAKSMTLTTSGFASASKITNVTINTSGASDTNAKVSVKVGGTSYSCNSNTTPAISTSATDYQFTGNSTGEIVISWSQTSSKAIYFKSITVEYSNTTTTPDVTTYSNYVTNCCALAPATILTVSGTTSNTATLTWTAPSPTTGITKLQVRNADNDAVVVDNIAVGTTTATITGLTECTKYNYYVVSVGDCEVFSNTVTAQPFSNAKTVNYDYNGGSGSPASFTTSCENQVITLPTATRAGYDFNGWYTAATGGTKVGDAGGTYDPTISSITLYAQWTKKIYIISFHANGGEGTMANQSADENDVVAQLNANQFTREGYAFVGWNTTAGGTGTAYADQATNIMLTQNRTLYAQWAAIVTLNDAGNVTTTHPAIAGGSITLEDGANACDPYEFVGWTSVATADWNEGINEPALVATTYTPNAPTTLYAVYKIQSEGNANAFKLSFEGGNGKTYYVGSYNSSPYLRGYSNITEEEAVTFIRTKMYPNDDTRYYLHMEHKGEYLYYTGSLNSTSSTPSESQGWVFHTVGDKIKLQSTYSYDPDYLSFSDRDQETINISTGTSGSEFNMLSAVTSTYVASPLCNQEIEIIFETGNGDFVDNAPATNPLTVSRGDVITLPTCEYPGYEFMGWMKDEQQLDPSDIIGTYYTGDYTVDGVSSTITFYAYYKAIPEEVEFTGKDDVELLMYYYDGTENYYYAVSHAAERGELSSKQNCFNATTWTFTNVGNMQYHIQDETGKYLGAYSDGDNDLILSATPKVWTFTEVNGLWKMVCENSPSRALMYISEGNRFTNAAITNEGNGAYSYVTLGICPYPTYTTNPVLTQGFIVTNTAMVTSAFGQNIKAANALTLETRNIELPCTFTITAPNITFYDNTGAEVTQLTASAASEQFELHFAYQPTAENTMEYPTITIVDDEMKTYTIKNRIYARSLPTTFAIVAKVGNVWYALPSQGLNSTDALVGYPVEVDNQNDPTAVTAVPENADWSLRGVYEASRSDATKDRFVANGENFVFVNNEGTPKALNASASGNYLLTDAQYSGYYETNPGLYEWTPTTSDLETYTLTNEQRADRTLNVSINTVFGVHYDNKATTEVRFLPIQGRYKPMAAQVVEWKENSVVVMYNGDPAQTASVSVNGGAAQTTELSSAQKDIAVYELTANGLATNPAQSLSITVGTEKAILPIPYVISGEKTDLALLPGATVAARQDIAKVSDLVILKGATLTAAGAKGNPYKFRNVTIYGGGSLVIPSDKGFGAASLTLRAGGITDAGEYDYVYPQFELRGTFTNSAAKINYDYITDYYHWYHLVLPFVGDLGTIKYPTEFYGANVAANNTGSWQIKRYAGEIRATGNYDAWVDIETEDKISTTAGQGYIFWGAPKKVSVNGGASTRQKWGIQRITMPITAPNAMTAENGDKAISELSSYANVPNNSGKDNDQGWNLIGNPYMVNLADMATTGLHACKLVEVIDPATGKWNGQWEWNDETSIRYLTIPSEHFDTYTAKTVAQSVPLVPGRAFFVQLEGEANGITFAAANRASLMPALLAENSDKPVDIETGIVLSNETLQDEVNFWIKDGKTNDYEYNADYPKTPNNNHFNIYGVHTNGDLSWVATGPEYAAESMPIGYQVPAAGTYTLSVSETYYSEDLQALYVTDHAMSPELTVDLMSAPYEFSVNQAETNNERFTISLILKSENQGPTTGWENIDVGKDQSIKFIYLDQLYILRNGIIYDATGQQIKTINK